MAEKNIENTTKSDINLALNSFDHHLFADINFKRHCLINNIYILKKVINIYIYIYIYFCTL